MSIERMLVTDGPPKEVERLDPSEAAFVVGDDDASVRLIHRCDDDIECPAWLALVFALGQQAHPYQGGRPIKAKYAAREERLWTFRPTDRLGLKQRKPSRVTVSIFMAPCSARHCC